MSFDHSPLASSAYHFYIFPALGPPFLWPSVSNYLPAHCTNIQSRDSGAVENRVDDVLLKIRIRQQHEARLV